MKASFFLFLKGIAIGIANIIPGVSGGTMAVVLGIYERLVESIGSFLTRPEKRKEYLLFIVLIGLGAVVGIKAFGDVLKWALEEHEAMTLLFFMGLILGSLPPVLRMSGLKRLKWSHALMMALGVAAVLALGDPEKKEAAKAETPAVVEAADAGATPDVRLTWDGDEPGTGAAGENVPPQTEEADLVLLGICGLAAGAAMIVPGVSGSLVLLLLGQYYVVILALHDMNLKVLAVVGICAALGVALFAKIIEIALKKVPGLTHSLIIGLVGGSIVALNPGLPDGLVPALSGTACLAAGSLLSFMFAGGDKAH